VQRQHLKRRRLRSAAFCLALAGGCLLTGGRAFAAEPPRIVSSSVTDVTANSLNLRASINPEGSPTTYRFQYIGEAAFEANLEAGAEGFAGAVDVPSAAGAPLGAGTTPLAVVQHVQGLMPLTAYRFRAIASNALGPPAIGPERVFATEAATNVFALPDQRAWEAVSRSWEGAAAIAPPGALFGGGYFQAASQGGAITYSVLVPPPDSTGSAPATQLLGRRDATAWSTTSLSPPTVSGAYGDHPDGVPYRAFSEDLSQAILFGGLACRGGSSPCLPTPVLPGSGAPPGFMAYYRQDLSPGTFTSLLGPSQLENSAVGPEHFQASLVGASADRSHVVLSSCAALSPEATEVPDGEGGCDPDDPNLYEWGPGGLAFVNRPPGGEPPAFARLAAQLGAVSDDGRRVYWIDTASGQLNLHEAGAPTRPVADGEGPGVAFQAASSDGGVAYFTRAGGLYRFDADADTSGKIATGIDGVLGASSDGSTVYFQTPGALKSWQNGATAVVASGAAAEESDYVDVGGTARVSRDGAHLAFLSSKELSPYDNAGRTELYLYGPPPGGGSPRLLCVSCIPTGEDPSGDASIPGLQRNGSVARYLPRVLSASGERIFFDTSDALDLHDTSGAVDVYEWEAQGSGDCNRAPGCLALISSGRDKGGARFLDASTEGDDVFFLTEASLVPSDPGANDVYDARVGGGIAEPASAIPCNGDACQPLPSAPEDPSPTTLIPHGGNPAAHYFEARKRRRRHHRHRRHGRGHRHHSHAARHGGGR
jgi:hypothetical protein